MYSNLVVTGAAGSYDLTTLAVVKAELSISGTTEDTAIATWITQASQAAAEYCNRVFPSETVAETFRERESFVKHDRIVLARFPVSAVASVVEDSTALVVGTDYEIDKDRGFLYRLSAGVNVDWSFTSLVVTYTAGYATLPVLLGRAAISLVKLLRANATRDPSLRSENILSGLYSYTLFNPGSDFAAGGMPADITAQLDFYRNITV